MPPTTSHNPCSANRSMKPTLISSRDPLSLPTTTTNFKRFVVRVGPISWLQDRIEQIVMWRKSLKVTAVWMAAYAFFCMPISLFFVLGSVSHSRASFHLLQLLQSHPSLPSQPRPPFHNSTLRQPQIFVFLKVRMHLQLPSATVMVQYSCGWRATLK